MLKPNTRTTSRKETFTQISAIRSHRDARDAITLNDPAWQSTIAPNPWRGIFSDGVKVMQIDSRQDAQSHLQRRSENLNLENLN